ncbi:DnaD domain protein [Defluviitalea phaphyphila]|uniref:DnaD domain protein n=1 Tax=Defluviitalea phaphyphila TaxID=1473580 RepID=UPI00073058ED|nr:DnaD domain protein [Defluviitalea phaphyphila]
MAILNIKNNFELSTTPIPNEFIDFYMPKANGNFVKVYLYGYRFSYSSQHNLTLKEMSEKLDLLESDIIKAFEYWKECGLMEFEWNEDDIIHISYLIPKIKEEKKVTSENLKKPVHIQLETRPNYSPEELTIYMKNPEINRLFKIAERYLGRMLSHNDLKVLYSLYDWLRLPLDVIELLLEHCISNNHRSMRYIEKVGLTWAEEGINTVEKAQARIKTFNTNYREIMKALGLNDRNPAPSEIEYMDRWLNALNIPLEIILEACKRTIIQTQKPSFQYIDSILNNWNKNKVKSIKDIEKLDNAYIKKKSMQNTPSSNDKNKQYYSKPSKFVNFKQREWDFDELERLEREYLSKQLSEER